MTQKELNLIIEKAEKWDKLKESILKFYQYDDKGEPIEDVGDLCDIGEVAAIHLGFL